MCGLRKLETEVQETTNGAPHTITDRSIETARQPIDWTETLEEKLSHRRHRRFRTLHARHQVEVLRESGNNGGRRRQLTHSTDPIDSPSPIRFRDAGPQLVWPQKVAGSGHFWRQSYRSRPRYLGGRAPRHAGRFPPDSLKANGKHQWRRPSPGGYAVRPIS